MHDIQGGDARRNAEIIREILSGTENARSNIVLLNAAAALTAGGKAKSLREGIDQARTSIGSGHALSRLDQLIDFSQTLDVHR